MEALKVMFYSLILATLVCSDAFGKKRQINSSFLSTDRSKIFKCKGGQSRPEIKKAWYGLRARAHYLGGCSSVPEEVSSRWLDFTDRMREECQGFRFEGRPACPLPSRQDMQDKHLYEIPFEGDAFWYICYECDESPPPPPNPSRRRGVRVRGGDGFDFYPVTTARTTSTTTTSGAASSPSSAAGGGGEGAMPYWDMSREEQAEEMRSFRDADDATRRRVASSFASGALNAEFLLSTRNNLSPAERERQAADFLRRAEESVGTMTNILREEDEMEVDVPLVGTVSMVKRTARVAQQQEGTLLHGVELPDQDSLRNSDGSVVASLFQFDEEATLDLDRSGLLSNVIAVTAYDSEGVPMSGLDLEEGLTFTLSWNKTSVGGGETPVCGYWDFQEEGWSSRGCIAVSKNDKNGSSSSSLTCQCRHLTNFAVVLDLADEAELEPYSDLLRVLTLVLCSLSACCLALSLLYFAGHRGNDRSDRVRINSHFCLNLLAVQILLVLSNVSLSLPTSVPWLCASVAALLHFFLVATFFWSLLSGHQIYVLLVEVFDTEKKRMKTYYLVGYLCPAAIVLTALAVDLFALGSDTYGTETHCWMRPNLLFSLSFLLPLGLVLTVNLSMLALVIVKVYRIKPRPQLFGQARGWFSLALLLGVTWAVGLLGKAFPGPLVAVAFVALNSLQGLLIFVFSVLMSQRCRARLNRELSTRGLPTTLAGLRGSPRGSSGNAGVGGGGGGMRSTKESTAKGDTTGHGKISFSSGGASSEDSRGNKTKVNSLQLTVSGAEEEDKEAKESMISSSEEKY